MPGSPLNVLTFLILTTTQEKEIMVSILQRRLMCLREVSDESWSPNVSGTSHVLLDLVCGVL